ncbi:MAG TPA: peptide MFS transporter [Polyangia bacterium]|nr:peptide MFS transporter [Polyangia bacterium]
MTIAVEAASAAHEKQPKGLFLLFGVEMWERFSFYGMRAILPLFLADRVSGGLGWSHASASRLMSWYGFSAYTLPLAGGYLADRYLGTHRSMVVGGAIIAAGHFCLAAPGMLPFFLGLALVVLGTGFFKANASTMVGQLYREEDRRRDGGYTIFYMGINVGALLGQLVCGFFGENDRWGWHYGFGAAGVGMVLGLALYVALRPRYLKGIGDAPRPAAVAATRVTAPLTADERRHLAALLIIMAFTVPFWMAFEQTGTSMNFFASEHTRRALGGFHVPAAWFQMVNPFVLITTAPFLAALWTRLGERGRDPSTPAKMSIALVLMGLGFVVMMGGVLGSKDGALVSPLWLIGAYTLHTLGELCLSPIGLSFVSKLAPAKLASLMMGAWFFATGISELLAGQLAAFTDAVARGEAFHLFGGQADFFFIFVVSSFVSAIVLMLVSPKIKKLMA